MFWQKFGSSQGSCCSWCCCSIYFWFTFLFGKLPFLDPRYISVKGCAAVGSPSVNWTRKWNFLHKHHELFNLICFISVNFTADITSKYCPICRTQNTNRYKIQEPIAALTLQTCSWPWIFHEFWLQNLTALNWL